MASQTLDDTIAALMSMGFEFQDAQDAIQYGKVVVQDAVEWLLAGKPGYAATGPTPRTLKLTDNRNTNLPSLQPDARVPFVNPLPVPGNTVASSGGAAGQSPTSPQSGESAEPSASDIDMEHQVVSRLHLSDTKLSEKRQFEEKIRNEAKKKAKLEKIQAKQERDRVLKEIAEDRKVTKMIRTYGPATPADSPSAAPQAAPQPTQSNEAVSSASSGITQCSIQIRLPNGRQLRKKLDYGTTLGQLWLNVLEEAAAETEGYSGFMQPFPRREFSASEMNKTLEQLGLVPSGSLVLKKMESSAAITESESETGAESAQEAPSESEPVEERRSPFGEWVTMRPEDNHTWGRGRTLEDHDSLEEERYMDAEEGVEEEEDEEMLQEREDLRRARHYWGRGRRLEGLEGHEMDDENQGNNNEDDDDQAAALNAMGGQAGGINPILQGFLGQHGGVFGGGLAGGAFMGVGQRLIPEGVPGADVHNQRPVGDLAAEAAQQRLAQPAPVLPSVSKPPSPVVQVRSLQDLCMAFIAERITCAGSRIYSVGRLPAILSKQLIQYLVQQKLLDVKTLRLFCSCYLQELILDTYIYATNELLHAVRLHPSLQVLSLHSCPLISDKGIENIADLKNLKVLNLGLCKQITNRSLKVIAGFPQLLALSLEETGVTDKGLIEYLASKPCLQKLNLNRTAVTNAILPHLKNLTDLQSLSLEETMISSLEGLRDLDKLVKLNVAFTAITTETLSHLVDHPTLTHLNLANTEKIVGDTALLHLSGLKLQTLYLPDRHTVTSAGLAHIAGFALLALDLTNYIHVGDEGMEHIGKITSLKKLILTNTKVTDEGLQLLSNLTRLEILHLDRTSVSDAGIRVVRAFGALSELSLSATNVTNHFLKEGVLHSCPRLSKLNLSRTHVGDKGVERLKLPHLTLLNLDCTGVHARVVYVIKANCPSLTSVTTANLTPVLEEEEEDD